MASKPWVGLAQLQPGSLWRNQARALIAATELARRNSVQPCVASAAVPPVAALGQNSRSVVTRMFGLVCLFRTRGATQFCE